MRNSTSKCNPLCDLDKFLSYDEETGAFIWLQAMKGRLSGKVAGAIDKDGYRIICFKGKLYKAHRLAWYIKYGYMPTETIDHINLIRDDNRINNLRLATMFEQGRNKRKPINNKSGYVGITWSASSNKWLAQVCFNKKTHYAGKFNDIEDAVIARNKLKSKLVSEL
ncbi:HNH endonuclease signature motif containing protein [Kluyvera sichuanensis]|nr:HNH endonuclease signature motif containing protein [Kluyvera sichuanensis]